MDWSGRRRRFEYTLLRPAAPRCQVKVQNDFKDKVIETNPVDTMVEVVVHHPSRRLDVQTGRNFYRAPLLSNVQTSSLWTNRTRPALMWQLSTDHAKSIIVFPPPRGYIAFVHAGGRANTVGRDREGHCGIETTMRPRMAHGVRRSVNLLASL